MPKPDLSTIPAFYRNYVAAVKEDALLPALEAHVAVVEDFLQQIPAGKWDHAYAPGKWTIKQLVQHVLDSERVFAYRALRFARRDHTPLPGFDENLFAENAIMENRTVAELLEEFLLVRKSSYLLFKSFTAEQLKLEGLANEQKVSVEAIGFILAGHMLHHIAIIRERYLG